MSTSYNAQINNAEGKYSIQFETCNYDYFKLVERAWCNSKLKIAAMRVSSINRQRELVYPTQTAGFPAAPLHKGQRKILCSTSELLLTNQKELRDIPFRARCYHS